MIRAWQCISAEMTVKCVKRCCTSDAVDGTDECFKEDGNVRSECEEDEGTD